MKKAKETKKNIFGIAKKEDKKKEKKKVNSKGSTSLRLTQKEARMVRRLKWSEVQKLSIMEFRNLEDRALERRDRVINRHSKVHAVINFLYFLIALFLYGLVPDPAVLFIIIISCIIPYCIEVWIRGIRIFYLSAIYIPLLYCEIVIAKEISDKAINDVNTYINAIKTLSNFNLDEAMPLLVLSAGSVIFALVLGLVMRLVYSPKKSYMKIEYVKTLGKK